jgi:hypothetical protein
MALYRAYNGAAAALTAALAPVATGTAIKTLLQLSPKSGIDLKPIGWGISFDGSAAATPGKVELIETDVAATVTAFATGDVIKMTNPAGPAADTAYITLGTANSGFTASAEGSITATRLIDYQLIGNTSQYIYQWALGTGAIAQAGKFLRIRVTFGTTVNAVCFIDFDL